MLGQAASKFGSGLILEPLLSVLIVTVTHSSVILTRLTLSP